MDPAGARAPGAAVINIGLLAALIAAGADPGGPLERGDPRLGRRPTKLRRFIRRHRQLAHGITVAKLRKWEHEALGLKKLPKDLHGHVRRREEFRRAAGSPLAGTSRVGA